MKENLVTSFWNSLFVISKAVELGDTMFLVLKKRPVKFLHMYHHATVLIYCWQSHSEHASTGLWFAAMNTVVHSIMYSYYAARTLGVKVGRRVAMTITAMQIFQMVFGLIVSFSVRAISITYWNVLWLIFDCGRSSGIGSSSEYADRSA